MRTTRYTHCMQTADRTRIQPFWKRLLPLMAAHFANDFYANVLPALLPLAKAKFDLSLALVGFASTAFTAAASLTQLLFGWFADRLSKVNFAIWGPVLTGVFMCLAGLMPTYALLLPMLVLSGLGTAMFHPQATAIAGALIKHRRGLGISLFIAGGSVGFSLSPIASASLFGSLGQTGGSWILLSAALIFLVFLRLTVPPPPVSQRHRVPQKIWEILRPLLVMWLIVVLRHAIFLSLITYLIILLQGRGYSYQQGSIALFLFLLGGALSSLLGGPLSDRFGRKWVVVGSFVLAYPCLLGFLNSAGWTAWVFLVISGMALAMNNPVIVAHAQETLPQHTSTASAVTMGLGWGVGSLLVSVVGLAADHWGITTALNTISAAAVLAAMLALQLKPVAADNG